MKDLNVVAIKALETNYIWVIKNQTKAIVIDPGETESVHAFLLNEGLDLHAIWITHHHSDHTDGVAHLLKHYPSAKLYAHKDHHLGHLSPILVGESDQVDAFGAMASVWVTAGHTKSHLSYVIQSDKTHVFCADTLFRAGCGRVFCGTITQLYHSLSRFNALKDDTLFYPAHEYTLDNLVFAQRLEPSNEFITHALTHAKNRRINDTPTLPTTLADERCINPFIRALSATKENELWLNAIDQSGQSIDDQQTLFAVLRALKDNA